MNQWTTKYLSTWQSDFKNEPNAELFLHFLKNVLAALTNLSISPTTTTHQTVASSAATIINAQQHDSQKYDLLIDLQALLFEAAIDTTSPYDPSDIAKVTHLLIQEQEQEQGPPPSLREKFLGLFSPEHAGEMEWTRYTPYQS